MVIGMLLFGENSLGWRVGSAVSGVISILGIYCLIRALSLSRSLALIASFLIAIEGLHIAQSRIAMNDIYLLNFYIWSLYAAVKSRWKLAAVLYGLALASKWSALYGIVPLAFIYLHQFVPTISDLRSTIYHLLYAVRCTLIAISFYTLSFAPFILAGHTWAQWWELHRQMWYYHTHLVATHGYQSTPWEWLFDVRPVWYWVQYGEGVISNIYAHGNPIILWLGLTALILQLKKIRLYPYSLFFILYSIFTLPWFFSPRIMFFYHYLPSSVFLCVILATWLADLPIRTRNGVMILCFIGLITISPFLYGFPAPHLYWDTIFKIFPSWK
jgi:dolichyl-phosphate-mannose--protein O-mannosyl transferase